MRERFRRADLAPAAFFAITLHTLELVSPAAATWEMPVIIYSVVPLPRMDMVPSFNTRTQQAAANVMTDPRLEGKTVVMVWEHHHIASKPLERQFAGQRITLRQLLNLDKLKDVPETWPGQNYNFFWIVDYGNPGSDVPTSFRMVKQVFAAPFDAVPANDWKAKESLPKRTLCKH